MHIQKNFCLEHSLHAIIQRLRISKQKTTKYSLFVAHIGRPFNTPISNVTTQSSNKRLKYNRRIKRYIDEDTIPGRSYLTDAQWASTGMCSNVEIEKVICAANARAHEEQEELKDGESRLMWSKGISRPIPRSERCVHLKIACKIQAAQRQTEKEFRWTIRNPCAREHCQKNQSDKECNQETKQASGSRLNLGHYRIWNANWKIYRARTIHW